MTVETFGPAAVQARIASIQGRSSRLPLSSSASIIGSASALRPTPISASTASGTKPALMISVQCSLSNDDTRG